VASTAQASSQIVAVKDGPRNTMVRRVEALKFYCSHTWTSKSANPPNLDSLSEVQLHESISVLCCDLTGFKEWCSTVPSSTAVACVSNYFQVLKDTADRCGVTEIETTGHNWMAICGAPTKNPDHAATMACFAMEVLKTLGEIQRIFCHPSISLRIGMHQGPAKSGISHASRWIVFGEAVEITSRIEATSNPEYVHISDAMFKALQDSPLAFVAHPGNQIMIPGKGNQDTFYLKSAKWSGGEPRVPALVPSTVDQTSLKRPTVSVTSASVPNTPIVQTQPKTHSFPEDNNDDIADLFAGRVSNASLSSMQTVLDMKKSNLRTVEEEPALLLVGETLAVLMQSRRLLKASGMPVYTAQEWSEGLALMKKQWFSVIFMDLSLSITAGSVCVGEFRSWELTNRKQRQKIVALTHSSEVNKGGKKDLLFCGFDAAESTSTGAFTEDMFFKHTENAHQPLSKNSKSVRDMSINFAI